MGTSEVMAFRCWLCWKMNSLLAAHLTLPTALGECRSALLADTGLQQAHRLTPTRPPQGTPSRWWEPRRYLNLFPSHLKLLLTCGDVCSLLAQGDGFCIRVLERCSQTPVPAAEPCWRREPRLSFLHASHERWLGGRMGGDSSAQPHTGLSLGSSGRSSHTEQAVWQGCPQGAFISRESSLALVVRQFRVFFPRYQDLENSAE